MVRTELDPAGLEKGARRVAGCLGGLKNAAEKLGEAIRTAFTAKKLTEFAKACLALQGEAAGVQSAVETAFGGMAYKMENFAKDAATQFGLSGTAAKKFGSEYMELAKSAGLAEGAASDMAVALTGLTGDTASAFGIDPAAAADKLKGIFTGEATGLRELGVMLSGTNLQQYALTHGINQSTAAMSEAQQTALRYAYVTDALRLVSGDFARTQGSWTGQTQLLTQQWRELMGVLGQAMATVLLPAVRVLNGIVAALTDTARAVTAVLGALFGKATTRSAATAQQNTAVAQSADMGARAEEGLAKSTRKAGEAANDALAPFDELNLLQKNAAAGETTPGGQAGGNGGKAPAPTVTAGTQVEDTLSPQLQAIVDKIRQLLEPLRAINFEPLAKAFERLKEAAAPLTKTLFAGLEWASYNIFVPLAAWTIEDLLPAFLDLLVAAIVLLIMNWDTVKEVALNVWAAIQEIWAAAAAWFQEYVLTPLGEFFSFLWQGIQAGALAVWEGIQTAWAVAADWFYNVLILPLTAHFTALFTFFKNIFQGLADFLSGVFTGDWKKAWEGIKKFAMAPIEAVKSFFEKIFGTDLGESIKGGLNTLIDLVNRFIGWLNEKLHFSWDGLTILGKELFPAGSVRLANIPSIPRLAQGAVLPANKPFLAMVGEQRHGTNVEAPLDTIKQAVAEVLGQLGGTQEFTAEQPVEIRLDGEVLYRAMERIRAARGVQIGGAFANAY